MVEIQRLSELDPVDLVRIAAGYSSTHPYRVVYEEAKDEVSFDLRLESLEKPISDGIVLRRRISKSIGGF
jgi:hypothetical protein